MLPYGFQILERTGVVSGSSGEESAVLFRLAGGVSDIVGMNWQEEVAACREGEESGQKRWSQITQRGDWTPATRHAKSTRNNRRNIYSSHTEVYNI
jgi:hypothetical protein